MALAQRVAAVVPLLAAVTTAVALTGAAFFTVAHAGCDEAGRFVRTGGSIEFVGGCVNGADLPAAPVTEAGVEDVDRFSGSQKP
ncbi:hypothetical protein SAMN05216553_111193 [Lentzea fradiae]|uniref:Secreted protein n=1 Tax=Lentzea fradiae TaxID=200378 RepID=A0A1G7X0Y5_9PSEU|nr:hypothetical protein [Lentzea fradiae]SDG77816.1 hypothetical protein SAMN05216553_111193 [Lentzea fradiae]